MTQRQPGDYVVNAELTDEQRERFVKDCFAAGADQGIVNPSQNYTGWQTISGKVTSGRGKPRGERDATDEYQIDYKDNPMTHPDLMRQIADAMERNPEGWWREFEVYNTSVDCWYQASHGDEVINSLSNTRERQGFMVRPKPRTYTLHVEDMPIHGEPFATFSKAVGAPGQVLEIRVNVPDEPTAREALEKLTKAMGGGND